MRSGRDRRGHVQGLPLQAVGPGGGRGRASAQNVRVRTSAHRHRRGIGRQRAARGGFSLHKPGQRDRAQPRTRGAGVSRRAGGNARGRDRTGGRSRRSGGGVSEFERVDSRVEWEGKIVRVGTERFRHADGEEVTREKVWHLGAVGIIPVDEEHVWLTRQPREAIDEPASLEVPAGKLDVEGEEPLATAKRELAEEIGKVAADWSEVLSFYTSPGFSDERVWL